MYSYAPKCSHLLSSKISKTTLRVYEYYEAYVYICGNTETPEGLGEGERGSLIIQSFHSFAIEYFRL